MMFFSKCLVRPRACTYRSDPKSCRLAYGITPFGSIACQSLTTIINGCAFMPLPCVSVHSRCISSHKTGALHTFFFRDKGEHRTIPSKSLRTLQLQHSRGAFSSQVFAIFLQPAVTRKCTTCRLCISQSALHHRGSDVQASVRQFPL